MALTKVNIDISGTFEATLTIATGTISISSTGVITDIQLPGNLSYNMSGKVSSIGGIAISYNMSGKVSSIAGSTISYNMSGKVSSIGGTAINYNMSGKISSVGGIAFNYNMSGKISSGNRTVISNGITFSLIGGF